MTAGGPPARTTLDETWDLPADKCEVAPARHHIRELAGKVLGNSERASDAQLAASEVLTNAVEHGGEGHSVHVRVFTTDTSLRVEVRDSGRGDAPYIPEEPTNDYGRGLRIVQAFTDRWGCMREANGLCVWFEVDFEVGS